MSHLASGLEKQFGDQDLMFFIWFHFCRMFTETRLLLHYWWMCCSPVLSVVAVVTFDIPFLLRALFFQIKWAFGEKDEHFLSVPVQYE